MRVRLLGLALAAAGILFVGCDSSGGGSSPKADNPGGAKLKPLPPPGSPGGGAPKAGSNAKSD